MQGGPTHAATRLVTPPALNAQDADAFYNDLRWNVIRPQVLVLLCPL